MGRPRRDVCRNALCWTALIFCVLALGALPASPAQLGLPKLKIPKIGKQETQPPTPARAKKPQVPGPDITSITPDSAPPGGDGEIVVTGKNLIQGLTINVCGARTKLDVQSP